MVPRAILFIRLTQRYQESDIIDLDFRAAKLGKVFLGRFLIGFEEEATGAVLDANICGGRLRSRKCLMCVLCFFGTNL